MSKIGVGVGEDFPVDDEKPTNGPQSGATDPDYAEYVARREAHRRWREARRAWKHRMREEWRAHRRAFRDEFRGRGRGGVHHPYWDRGGHGLWHVLAVVGAVALIVFAFTHIYFILGAMVVLVLCAAAFRHGFDPFDLGPFDHHDARSEPPRPTPPATPAGDPQT